MAWGKALKARKTTKQTIRFRGRAFHLNAFARKHGIDKSYLSRILSGKRPVDNLSVAQARMLTAAFDCTIDELQAHILFRRQLLDQKRAS